MSNHGGKSSCHDQISLGLVFRFWGNKAHQPIDKMANMVEKMAIHDFIAQDFNINHRLSIAQLLIPSGK
jgi:hypothetical protein